MIRYSDNLQLLMNIYRPVIDIINSGTNFLIASHGHPDGDGIGSTIALGKALQAMGKNVVMFNADNVPHNLKFLPHSNELVNRLEAGVAFDVTFMVDCSQRERIGGDVAKLSRGSLGKVVLIDHHRLSSQECDIECVDADAAAAGEVVYRLMKAAGMKLTKELATLIFCTFVVDTGSFRYSNTSSALLKDASELVQAGASPWEISLAMDESNPPEQIKLLRLVLETFELQGKLAWVVLSQQMLKEAGASADIAEEFINYPRSMAGVEVALLFRELKSTSSESARGGGVEKPVSSNVEKWKVSFRSKDSVDVYKIASVFKGGGHAHAAGCTLEGSLASVKAKVFEEVKRYI